MADFRPISLCNVVYKLISKTIANRFKALLPHTISENQSAFFFDRLIIDNVLVAFELMHFLNHKNAGKEGYMVTKLDMSKAFDRVECCFIKAVMEKLGFSSKWVDLVMRCITSVSYSVLINGVACGNITPSRGLQQGDSLSPTLFLICTEGLSALIHEVACNHRWTSISICRGCPRVTHLLFTDDSILFCKACVEECQVLKQILQNYEEALGQKISTEKSSIFFSPNTPQEVKDEIFATFGPMQDSRHTRYLGLPSFIGRLKKQVFSILKERIGQKLARWKGQLLSIGGKEILIKAVAQAIPTYTMGCFFLPQSLCEEIETMMRNFWWGQRQQETKMCWLWRILQNLNSLVARVLKSKYFPTRDILNAKIGNSPSYSWSSIHSSLGIIRVGTRWRVGNGKLIHIWDDKWLPTPSTYKVISPPNDIPQFPMVSSLINPMTYWWNVDLIRATFLLFEAEIILKIPLSRSLPEDKIIWIGNRHRDFTVKSAYHIAHSLIEENDHGESSSRDPCKPFWKRLWRLNLPAKIKVFAWRACINGLPIMEVISRRGISQCMTCHVYGNEAEIVDHALLRCDFSSLVWDFWLENPLRIQGFKNSFLDLALFILSHSTLPDLEIFFATAWALWSNRNRIVHKDNGLSALQVWHMARNAVEDFACSLSWDFDSVRPAASKHDGSSSVGVVIRGSNGLVVVALCLLLQSYFSAELTEVFALVQEKYGGSEDKIDGITNTTGNFSAGSVSVGGEDHSGGTGKGKNSNSNVGSIGMDDVRGGASVQGAAGDSPIQVGQCAMRESESREMSFFPPFGTPRDLRELKGLEDAFSLMG
ncbi:uncharacterized protein LOC136064802 [Quercus suber]|uniref:uncharacterized protein LOC136064802 n=1 Tax=Quercus suber TaxID=58331 RepID=UPI0032E01095